MRRGGTRAPWRRPPCRRVRGDAGANARLSPGRESPGRRRRARRRRGRPRCGRRLSPQSASETAQDAARIPKPRRAPTETASLEGGAFRSDPRREPGAQPTTASVRIAAARLGPPAAARAATERARNGATPRVPRCRNTKANAAACAAAIATAAAAKPSGRSGRARSCRMTTAATAAPPSAAAARKARRPRGAAGNRRRSRGLRSRDSMAPKKKRSVPLSPFSGPADGRVRKRPHASGNAPGRALPRSTTGCALRRVTRLAKDADGTARLPASIAPALSPRHAKGADPRLRSSGSRRRTRSTSCGCARDRRRRREVRRSRANGDGEPERYGESRDPQTGDNPARRGRAREDSRSAGGAAARPATSRPVSTRSVRSATGLGRGLRRSTSPTKGYAMDPLRFRLSGDRPSVHPLTRFRSAGTMSSAPALSEAASSS